jgi:hypothetical protein
MVHIGANSDGYQCAKVHRISINIFYLLAAPSLWYLLGMHTS